MKFQIIKNLINRFSKPKHIKYEPRMYLILREDLAYKYIQGGHALANFALSFPNLFKEWNNQYLICLSVFNGLALNNLRIQLILNSVTHTKFIEPDLESEIPTALCFFDDGKNNYRSYVKHLSLATK
jgi:hypothetical protein